LALLKLETQTPEHLPLSAAPPQLGERVFTIGYPGAKSFDSSPTFSEGSVASLSAPGGDATFLQITAPVEPGSSGGPVV
ncbi:MAG: serine protease, partial [Gammaproteobacteria bacterium]|nr:trypsin-like peptidase domain-containing protein [Gemmatimonadota bacterium]NIT65837.1 trypsin-like peptidase domain-containing protein [Gemmatimonadota bacterium]NIV19477.1 serine protease [Gammaproteobacteria bacterium]NIY34415.1 serine protease [Gemmatimonadota bacterium]